MQVRGTCFLLSQIAPANGHLKHEGQKQRMSLPGGKLSSTGLNLSMTTMVMYAERHFVREKSNFSLQSCHSLTPTP